ncbi:MAG: RES family NAD+ phosphorylase, partial [Actinomycetota bacterium]|nr:RES family NAD+ phosphorylase [Actinomycetota bacterium]
EPLSGEGARIHGGRFNPPGSFPALYLCQSRPCAVAELRRFGERQSIGVEGLLPRLLYRYEINLDRVLDLTNDEVSAQIGLSLDVLTGPDWTTCRELGSTLHALGAQGIKSPSATGVGEILVVFVQQIGLGRLEPHLAEEWHSIDQVEW